MSIAPFVALACGVIGSVSGTASGARDSILMAIVGAVFGFFIGFGCFLALAIPYVWCLIILETRPRLWTIWQYFFLPVMLAMLIVAALLPWYLVGLVL
jgi:hypothetical protein